MFMRLNANFHVTTRKGEKERFFIFCHRGNRYYAQLTVEA
jgi:hypothetical protein